MRRHALLERQLRRLGLDASEAPCAAKWVALIDTISRTYVEADQDRYTMERALSISSRELRALYDDLKASSETRLAVERDKLKKSLAIREATLEAAVDGILIVDEHRSAIGYNRRFVEMWGIPQAILETRADTQLLEWTLAQMIDPTAFLAHVEYLYEHPRESSKDEIHTRDGRTIERHSAPVVIEPDSAYGRVWFFRDITERERDERRIREMNRFLDSVFENIPNMVFVKDAETLEFVRFNRAGEQLVGWNRDELIGKSDHDFFPRDQADQFAAADRAVLAQHGMVVVDAERIETRSQGTRWLTTKKIPIFDHDGDPKYLLGISEDITEKRQQESALREAKETAEKASRAKSDFLANMSHELRTPLNSILGFARVIERSIGSKLAVNEREFLKYIVQSGEHMLRLVNDLLDLRSLEEGKVQFEPVDLASALDEAVTMTRPLIDERRLALTLHIAPSLPAACAERRAVVQILINLLSNAVKFTAPGGSVTISATTDGALLYLSVTDTGIGIAPVDQARLFTYFAQVGGKHAHKMKGSGIGLALTRALAEKLGGTISVESAPGVGSTFQVRLGVAA
jgi:PAS domain S-box-containing protein